MSGTRLGQVLAYAARGWPVFPCLPGQKIPATKHGFRPHAVIFDELHAQKNRDLYEALKHGKVAGAAFDVFETEPNTETPLLELDNFIATPHLGASTASRMKSSGR